jgi:hypothetical protein
VPVDHAVKHRHGGEQLRSPGPQQRRLQDLSILAALVPEEWPKVKWVAAERLWWDSHLLASITLALMWLALSRIYPTQRLKQGTTREVLTKHEAEIRRFAFRDPQNSERRHIIILPRHND